MLDKRDFMDLQEKLDEVWHCDSFNVDEWDEYNSLFESVIEKVSLELNLDVYERLTEIHRDLNDIIGYGENSTTYPSSEVGRDIDYNNYLNKVLEDHEEFFDVSFRELNHIYQQLIQEAY